MEEKNYHPEIERLYAEFKDYLDEIGALRKLLKTLHFALSPEQVQQTSLNIAMEIISYQACAIFLWNDEHGAFELAARRNVDPAIDRDFQAQQAEGLYEWVTRENKPIFVPTQQEDQRVSYVLVPLARGEARVGIMVLRTTDECTPRHLELLSNLADEAAAAITNLNLYREVVRTKNNLLNIMAAMPDGVLSIDTGGVIRLLSGNGEAVLRLTAAAVVGKRCEEVFPPAVARTLVRMQERTLRSGRIINHDIEYTAAEVSVPLRVNTAILYDEFRTVTGTLFVFSDISETRELLELKRLDELKTAFLNNVSHELKTPLTSMKWAIDLLREAVRPLGGGDNILKLLTIINDDNERLIELVTELLDYSRIESGKVKLECVRLDMVALLYDCQSRLRMMAERGRVGITLHLDDAIPQVWADAEKLRQVFANLLHNAVKFSPPDTVVTVRVVVEQKMFGEKPGVVCRFSDQGIGIPFEELDRIFDKFHRVTDPKTRNVPGAGLGLSISKSIIELHGGRITVERNAGPGTTFNVILPLREE